MFLFCCIFLYVPEDTSGFFVFRKEQLEKRSLLFLTLKETILFVTFTDLHVGNGTFLRFFR